jgi:hypothetical protein
VAVAVGVSKRVAVGVLGVTDTVAVSVGVAPGKVGDGVPGNGVALGVGEEVAVGDIVAVGLAVAEGAWVGETVGV